MSDHKFTVIPSIASGDLLNIEKDIEFIDKKYGSIHIDIEDGNYISNITFGSKLMKMICKKTTSSISIHLMVTNPVFYLDDICECNPDIVFIHTDVTRYGSELIRAFQDKGILVGIAMNPNIAVQDVEYLLPQINDVLILTCEPDRRNQLYIEAMENKIRILKNQKKVLWADGGITVEKLGELRDMGIGNVILGRTIFENRNQIIK